MNTCTADLSDKIPFEGWLVLGWVLAMSNHVIEMRMKIKGEEKLTAKTERGREVKVAERQINVEMDGVKKILLFFF